mmetsp:Transcript_1233/g.3111  ORF Transcript_1233/g.3111 Transcript_1233/m.3111 type:complete len:105 (+) Transcript_1233:100-414(+)
MDHTRRFVRPPSVNAGAVGTGNWSDVVPRDSMLSRQLHWLMVVTGSGTVAVHFQDHTWGEAEEAEKKKKRRPSSNISVGQATETPGGILRITQIAISWPLDDRP